MSQVNIDRTHHAEPEKARRQLMLELFKQAPLPEDELLSNLGLFMSKTEFARILYMNELYRKQLEVHGVIMEFGVRWGQNLALFETLRGIYEPFNRNRKIIGFDTFAGFPSVDAKDGTAEVVVVGGHSVTKNYEEYLARVLDCHEQEGTVSHVKKYELCKGDASQQIVEYLHRHPETIISMAFFDFDLYEPTKNCLEAIKPHLTRGSIIAFDELGVANFPGETLALKETFGLGRHRLVHMPFSANRAYFVLD
jgi:hypothetical protein